MKKILLILAITASFLQAEVLHVSCGIPPLLSMVRSIGGERVQASSLMSSSHDPCTWSPSPKAVTAVRDADLFFTIGMSFEQVISDKLIQMNSGLLVVNVAEGLDSSGDPHIWVSLSMLSKMADAVAVALSAADPESAGVYRTGLATYKQRLDAKHQEFSRKLEPLKGRSFFVYHPVMGHFAKDYGLKQTVVEVDGKSPSPKSLLNLIHRAKEDEVRVIFVQPQFDQSAAEMIATRIGGRVVEMNTLSEDPIEVLERTVNILQEAYANKP